MTQPKHYLAGKGACGSSFLAMISGEETGATLTWLTNPKKVTISSEKALGENPLYRS